MRSPFPGMDPYLESHWGDIHHRLVIYTADALQPGLPPDLRARVEERVFVQDDEEVQRIVLPDVRVVERPSWNTGVAPEPDVAVAVAEPQADPILVKVERETYTEGYIEIRDAGSGGKVITAIEVLSLTNKYAKRGQEQYRQKQKEMKDAGVNLVEIDLLRRGPWVILPLKQSVPTTHREPYRISIHRAGSLNAEMYRASFRDPLPTIKIPLRPTDEDVEVNLQELIDRCYVNGAYDDIDYKAPLDPPLKDDDAEWVLARFQELGIG